MIADMVRLRLSKRTSRALGYKERGERKEIDPERFDQFQNELDGWIRRTGVPRLQAITYPLVAGTGANAVRFASSELGLSFNVLQPGLLEYAANETQFLARVMGETLGSEVARTVQLGLEAGDTVTELTRRLQEAHVFSRDRARLVARTETTRAWNGAQRRSLQAYQQASGKVIMKTWLTAQDDRVRPEHEEMEGQQQRVDEPFSNDLMEPSEPNCRCTLTYALVEEVAEVQPAEEEPPVEDAFQEVLSAIHSQLDALPQTVGVGDDSIQAFEILAAANPNGGGSVSARLTALRGATETTKRVWKERVNEGVARLEALVSKDILPKKHVNFSQGDLSLRAYQTVEWSDSRQALVHKIATNVHDDVATVVHELGHAIEYDHPDILKKSVAFRNSRAVGEQPVMMQDLFPGSNYDKSEITLRDKFAEPYAGKLYQRPAIRAGDPPEDWASEVLSVGLQKMVENPLAFRNEDREYFDFILSVVWGQ